MVTSCLIHILNTSRTNMKQTNSKIDFVVKYTVGTGLVICIFNTLILAFAIAYPHNWVFASIAIVATKLYANSFLVALNTRDSLMGTEVFKMGHSTQFSSGVSNETNRSKSKITSLRLVRGPRPRNSMSAPAEGPNRDVQESGDVIELKQMSDSDPFGLTTDRLEPNRADVIDIKPLAVVGDIV
ncbi:hypothetical protein C8Q74DRAFT_971123 [Fomes fomentarius]|nr:hypothetical protein C8Q74DRAFT_971123 [Fomes fomentarius]